MATCLSQHTFDFAGQFWVITMFMVIVNVDLHSKWRKIVEMKGMSAKQAITELSGIFSAKG